MMEPVHRVDDKGANPIDGRVVFDVPKLIWNLGMLVLAFVFAPFTISVNALILFIFLTYFHCL